MQFTDFEIGSPLVFVIAKDFGLGAQGIKLARGMKVKYDGNTLSAPGYPPFELPNFRGAIRSGWVVPLAEYDAEDFSATRAKSANIQVGNLKDKTKRSFDSASIEDEEREVTNVKDHAKHVQASKKNYGRSNNSMVVVEDQEGQEVTRTFRTSAKGAVVNTDSTRAYSEAQDAIKKLKIEPVRGPTREDVLARMSPRERQEYLAKLDAKRGEYNLGANAATLEQEAHEHKRVARVNSTKDTTVRAGSTAIADYSGSTGKVQVSVEESEGVKFTNTNTHRPKAAPPRGVASGQALPKGGDPRRRIAKRVCADFPDQYDFDAPEKRKIARITADFEDRPDVIQAIFAAENDSMKDRLLAEFPEAF